MGKFPFKRLRIISKNFPEIDSHVDRVSKSLEGLVFSYSRHVDRTLQKKHLMMAASSLTLLIVLGSFLSPTGKADSSIFYPKTCLGGWINTHNAEGEGQTTSNGDASQFTAKNSAILPKNTNADIYCGNFTGTFDETTKPTKILVSLSLTKGQDYLLETTIVGDSFASSSGEILDITSSTEVSFTLQASSTDVTKSGSTTLILASTTETSLVQKEDIATTSLPIPVTEEAVSLVSGAINVVKDALINLFKNVQTNQTETDTVVIPIAPEQVVPQQAPPQSEQAPVPTSFLETLLYNLAHNFVLTVFAQQELVAPLEPQTVVDQTTEAGTTTNSGTETTLIVVASSTAEASTSTLIEVSAVATTTEIVASSTEKVAGEDNQFQNNFLEVFYTFDGTTWKSLGELNEISMKYRTFEIPVDASTSWNDMSQLQIKIESKKQLDDTPTIYLDSIKVDVIYERTLTSLHPDFSRDTILKDETIDGVRMVTIINNDNNQEELWYMYLDDKVAAEAATSTLSVASSTDEVGATSTLLVSSSTKNLLPKVSTSTEILSNSTSTATGTLSFIDQATSTPNIKPIIPKNKWFKFEGVRQGSLSGKDFVQVIKKRDENPDSQDEKIKEDEMPDFALDIIKRIKGTFLNAIVVQLQKGGEEELWLYDVENNTQEKIDTGTSTSLSVDSPLGVKGGYVFWLSEDRSLVFAYNIVTKEIKSQSVPSHNVSLGERGEVIFESIPWKVILGTDSFLFYSEATGEVFSDENGSVAEALRQKLKLDTLLNEEELSNLNLQVDASTVKEPSSQ